MEDRYLGDGVYASYDGFHIWLDLRAQHSGNRIKRVALDPRVMLNLINYDQEIRHAEDSLRHTADVQRDDDNDEDVGVPGQEP